MTGFFAETIHARANALQRAVDFEEPIVFRPKFRPEQIAVELLLGGVCDIDAEHLCGSDCLPGVLSVSAGQSIAQMKQGVIVPVPLGGMCSKRSELGVLGCGSSVSALGALQAGDRSRLRVVRGFMAQLYATHRELLREAWQSVVGFWPATGTGRCPVGPAKIFAVRAGKKCDGFRRGCSAEHRDR
jgi:hypothetical protein